MGRVFSRANHPHNDTVTTSPESFTGWKGALSPWFYGPRAGISLSKWPRSVLVSCAILLVFRMWRGLFWHVYPKGSPVAGICQRTRARFSHPYGPLAIEEAQCTEGETCSSVSMATFHHFLRKRSRFTEPQVHFPSTPAIALAPQSPHPHPHPHPHQPSPEAT